MEPAGEEAAGEGPERCEEPDQQDLPEDRGARGADWRRCVAQLLGTAPVQLPLEELHQILVVISREAAGAVALSAPGTPQVRRVQASGRPIAEDWGQDSSHTNSASLNQKRWLQSDIKRTLEINNTVDCYVYSLFPEEC